MSNTAPLWQVPGVGWDSVPFVPYESFTEYKSLLKGVVDEYTIMIREVIESGDLRLWSVSRYGLTYEMKQHWNRHGVGMLLRFTKGVGKEWCESVNSFLVNTLDTAARVFVFCSVPFPVVDMGNFRDTIQDVFEILERELCLFMHSWVIHPMGTYSFYLANFVYYQSLSGESNGSVDDDCRYMPIGKFQHIMAAFAMGVHPRLGSREDCVVSLLSDEILRIIFSCNVF